MHTVETREFRANLAEMLRMAENTPIFLDRGAKGLVVLHLAQNCLKSLANSSNVVHPREFRNNLAKYLDQAEDKLTFVRNSSRVLLQITIIPKQYCDDIRNNSRLLMLLNRKIL